MKIRYILCLLLSCFFVIVTEFHVEGSERESLFHPKYVVSQEQCVPVDKKYNHYAYEEVSSSLLEPVGNGQKLHKDAAKAFEKMRLDAQSSGITLTPISGFRSKSEQDYLFYEVAKQRSQTLEQRAKVSAPPVYSQHHTGLSIDVNSLNPSFANTKEFSLLQKNAKQFDFELSFAEGNSQSVSFEPWHWAWHGNEDAKRVLHDGCI